MSANQSDAAPRPSAAATSDEVDANEFVATTPQPAAVPDQLCLAQEGSRVHVAFNYKDIPDEARVAGYRSQLTSFLQRTGCRSLTFDLEGLKLLPSRMLGFFLALKNEGHDIELVNVAPFIQDIFRVTKLAPIVTIRSGGA